MLYARNFTPVGESAIATGLTNYKPQQGSCQRTGSASGRKAGMIAEVLQATICRGRPRLPNFEVLELIGRATV